MTTVAVPAALALYGTFRSDAVPLLACAVTSAVLYPWRRPSPPR
jgi:hypothetical protein